MDVYTLATDEPNDGLVITVHPSRAACIDALDDHCASLGQNYSACDEDCKNVLDHAELHLNIRVRIDEHVLT